MNKPRIITLSLISMMAATVSAYGWRASQAPQIPVVTPNETPDLAEYGEERIYNEIGFVSQRVRVFETDADIIIELAPHQGIPIEPGLDFPEPTPVKFAQLKHCVFGINTTYNVYPNDDGVHLLTLPKDTFLHPFSQGLTLTAWSAEGDADTPLFTQIIDGLSLL